MVSKSYCPYCAKAKSVLKLYKLNPEDYEILEIDGRPDMDEIQEYYLLFVNNKLYQSLYFFFDVAPYFHLRL